MSDGSMIPPPSPADLAVLKMIQRAALTGGQQPTNDDIAHLLGAKSTSSAVGCVNRLAHHGYLKVERVGRSGRIFSSTAKSLGEGGVAWRLANRHADCALENGRVEYISHQGNTTPRGPRRKQDEQAPPRPAAAPEASSKPAPSDAPATGLAAGDGAGARQGDGAADAGAPPAAYLRRRTRTGFWTFGDDPASIERGIAEIRAQVAAVGARMSGSGPRVKSCCWPMWPHKAPCPPIPFEDDPAQFGPPLFCGEELAMPGRPYCRRHTLMARRSVEEAEREEEAA